MKSDDAYSHITISRHFNTFPEDIFTSFFRQLWMILFWTLSKYFVEDLDWICSSPHITKSDLSWGSLLVTVEGASSKYLSKSEKKWRLESTMFSYIERNHRAVLFIFITAVLLVLIQDFHQLFMSTGENLLGRLNFYTI